MRAPLVFSWRGWGGRGSESCVEPGDFFQIFRKSGVSLVWRAEEHTAARRERWSCQTPYLRIQRTSALSSFLASPRLNHCSPPPNVRPGRCHRRLRARPATADAAVGARAAPGEEERTDTPAQGATLKRSSPLILTPSLSPHTQATATPALMPAAQAVVQPRRGKRREKRDRQGERRDRLRALRRPLISALVRAMAGPGAGVADFPWACVASAISTHRACGAIA